MDQSVKLKGEVLEVLGVCMTNTRPDSVHIAEVKYWHLWSYAQQAALIAVSDKDPKTYLYDLIDDPERRAKRIAANYADLYFKSATKTHGKVQFHWVALAAFVVKDIVEAFRFAREDVLQREWKAAAAAASDGKIATAWNALSSTAASVARNSPVADVGSVAITDASPYQHVLRTYAALAKGNLWLFMDIFPFMWFFLKYGINPDGSLNHARLENCLSERDWNTFQIASKTAIEDLPFGPKWIARMSNWLDKDVVYKKGQAFFEITPSWSQDGGYGAWSNAARFAHNYCKVHVKEHDKGYRTPASHYWGKFQEAFYVMESEHIELSRVVKDSAATAAVVKARNFKATPEIRAAYLEIIESYSAKSKLKNQQEELAFIANHEQRNVLQPLIYNDPKLIETMDMNHRFSRLTGGWISPQFKVVYSFSPKTDDPKLQTVFDAPDGVIDRFIGKNKSLPNEGDRMNFVADIARDFNRLMFEKRSYMEAELRKIQGWLNA
ncbi:DUF2515 family protein [Undibacterium sp. Ren11W]|uniref:DUF2515 family protein n=1 Tax=Undibacterium sp. Ren11W TaxID=3413045 RepID=UPI003BF2F66A